MNITKLSGSIFMVFVLISAPFFAIQTKQDGINRVLADDFQFNDIILEQQFFTKIDFDFIDNSRLRLSTGIPEFNTDYARTSIEPILSNIIKIEDFSTFQFIQVYNSNLQYLGYYDTFAEVRPDPNSQIGTIDSNIFILDSNVSYIAASIFKPGGVSSTISLSAISFSYFNNFELLQEIEGTITSSLNYYQIFENARLANYSDVDGFTNIFYQIPRMASSIANTYNRFIGFTDNLNPFRVRDESTGEFRDQTPSEVMDSWPARIISWFRRFTD